MISESMIDYLIPQWEKKIVLSDCSSEYKKAVKECLDELQLALSGAKAYEEYLKEQYFEQQAELYLDAM